MSNYKVLLIVFAVWNLMGFLLMGLDKLKAQHKRQRIREITFFIIAALGAAPGILTGMRVFRHKTLHKSFTLGIPAILILQAVLLLRFAVLNH
jgi:uncharacterized membrane protein YsdA (DUF1294 family)